MDKHFYMSYDYLKKIIGNHIKCTIFFLDNHILYGCLTIKYRYCCTFCRLLRLSLKVLKFYSILFIYETYSNEFIYKSVEVLNVNKVRHSQLEEV